MSLNAKFFILGMATIAVLALALFPLLALADTSPLPPPMTSDGNPFVQEWINAACADNGALLGKWTNWLLGLLGTFVGASVVQNFRRFIPMPLMKVLDVLALNFVKGQAVPPAGSGGPGEPSAVTPPVKP